jgi:conserved oligomeric Golgi complex subunit 5
MTAIKRELSAIIDKLHRVDFGRVVDPVPGMGGPSFYMKDLVEKLTFIKTEVLSKFNLGETGRLWFAPFLLSLFIFGT